jgi:hypothetical protein
MTDTIPDDTAYTAHNVSLPLYTTSDWLNYKHPIYSDDIAFFYIDYSNL